MNNYVIRKALDKKLEALSIKLGLPVSWENIEFSPPATGVFLEADFLPAENEDYAIQGTATIRRGVYQVTVVCPIGTGNQTVDRLAVAIIEEFPNNQAIPAVGKIIYVNGEPSVFNGIKDTTAYRLPISIAYIVTA